ncbi:hypothetical protein GGR50DRAFT_369929 [Xylaria sp. CBS 124048]|nr:hypothetical protein GGR50DRAFT_369929 [Xylaria sp. CBS 124048]
MAPRKVIADSEDEDDEDFSWELNPEDDGCGRPEPELLSPHHRPSSPAAPEQDEEPPDVTDPSFFTDIYTNQQGLAVQQARLIENIVRQSQRASGSSGDVSLPLVKMGAKANRSSGTDVTSPMNLGRPCNNMALVGDGASEFTTPGRSMAQVWDIPSSAEVARSRGKPHFKSKRPIPKEPVGYDGAVDCLHENSVTSPASMPSAKRAKVSHHDTTQSRTSTFYIAPSTLTTMQKLEYQKVDVPTNGYGGIPGFSSTTKSSYAATIPYSTPSGYSSMPRPPREDSPMIASPQRDDVITISSSPDAVASGLESPARRRSVVDSEAESPMSNKSEFRDRAQNRKIVSKKKQTVPEETEQDELSRDNTWDADEIGLPRELYKPRPSKRRAAAATANFPDVGYDADIIAEVSDGAAIRLRGVTKPPASSSMDIDPLVAPSEAPPKPKRGRKKKGDVMEASLAEIEPAEVSYLEQDFHPSSEEAEVEPVKGKPKEKPKKKPGRSRKKETANITEKAVPEPPIAKETLKTGSPQQDDDLDRSAAPMRKEQDGGKGVIRKERKPVEDAEATEDTESKEARVPLKEVESNTKTPSELLSTEETPRKAIEPKEEKAAAKMQSRETAKPATLQPKATYRVGLSKRSRIAPLLKTIRK